MPFLCISKGLSNKQKIFLMSHTLKEVPVVNCILAHKNKTKKPSVNSSTYLAVHSSFPTAKNR